MSLPLPPVEFGDQDRGDSSDLRPRVNGRATGTQGLARVATGSRLSKPNPARDLCPSELFQRCVSRHRSRQDHRHHHAAWLAAGGLLVVLSMVLDATAEVTCRASIFGGEDCAEGGSRTSSSRPNIYGGYDTRYSDGSETTSRPNIFGGQDVTGKDGSITSRPNIFGGEDYRLPGGKTVTSHPNIYGGQDYRQPDGKTVTCRPNIFGGQDCR